MRCSPAVQCAVPGAQRAVRPLPIKVAYVTKGSSKAGLAYADEWKAKLQAYTRVETVQLKPNPSGTNDVEAAKKAEAQRLLKLLTPQDCVLLLDERGSVTTSEGLAELLAAASDQGASSIVCLIGGPYGVTEQVRQRATKTLRLSAMVLNHQVALVVLLEQLYRAWTILRGHPYHH